MARAKCTLASQGEFRILGRDVGSNLLKLAKAAAKVDKFFNRQPDPGPQNITSPPVLFVDSDGRCYVLKVPKTAELPPAQ